MSKLTQNTVLGVTANKIPELRAKAQKLIWAVCDEGGETTPWPWAAAAGGANPTGGFWVLGLPRLVLFFRWIDTRY